MKAVGDKQRCFKTLWDVVPRHKLKLKLETASEVIAYFLSLLVLFSHYQNVKILTQ